MFKTRSTQKEIMDDLEISSEICQTLRELDIINRRLGGNRVTLSGLDKILSPYQRADKEISIVDLGCGGGDILKATAVWGREKGLNLKLTGIDANPYIIELARENTRNFPEISYQITNIFSDDFKSRQFDVVMCSLFTHHFSDQELVCLLAQLKSQFREALLINDLHRHPFAYYAIKFLTKVFSRSAMVKNDGPVSVLRAFSKQDWEHILSQAGLHDYTLDWMWAFRWRLMIQKSISP
jgi:2-polyprenyl-3-methyl-5-hydroxy-6-metoxy-1,4-benzoquinol methylase